ncbi:MAG: hypothetical protein LBR18_00755 [Tannerella sp.]|jgi:dsDNA-specific endonuclease/ATPase MutS2|nr:hypothetical protein [Tannerella sp.]
MDRKQVIELILHERMKTKAQLEMLRFMHESNTRKSYENEINKCLDRMSELEEMYNTLINEI